MVESTDPCQWPNTGQGNQRYIYIHRYTLHLNWILYIYSRLDCSIRWGSWTGRITSSSYVYGIPGNSKLGYKTPTPVQLQGQVVLLPRWCLTCLFLEINQDLT